MSITRNPTLPNDWDSTASYELGDQVYYAGMIFKSLIDENENHAPNTRVKKDEYWELLTIVYLKDVSVMEDPFSGEENMWERDQLYINEAGYIYLNNENTGINVRGQSYIDVRFEDLTPEQRALITGPKGDQGIQGPQGEPGPTGAVEWDNLTPEQIAQLKGDDGADGKSTYQIWLDQGYTGTEQDFLNWVRARAITVDTELSSISTNPVQNRVITRRLNQEIDSLRSDISILSARVIQLENLLSATYNSQNYNFQFGITEAGDYGYVKNGNIIPFNQKNEESVQISTGVELLGMTFNQNLTNDVSNQVAATIFQRGDFRSASLDEVPSTSNELNDNLQSTNVIEEEVDE